ncbi:threonine synthase [Catenulispora sp. GP43]
MTGTTEMSFPVEVDYDYDRVDPALFDVRSGWAGHGLDRWAPLLPPLLAPGLGEGGTPLVEIGGGVWIKDESRNPTWSHKDRLNRCAISAAVGAGARGVVVASSGNHGASAAAYAARAGLRCAVIVSDGAPPAVMDFVNAYGAHVFRAPAEERVGLVRHIVAEFGYHPVSNLTPTHTGHAFGPEGYKTIAYEIYQDLGVPAAVFVPTGYGELLFGVWKGFVELQRLGVAEATPRMIACEPATAGALREALAQGVPATAVSRRPSDAYAINCRVGGYRSVVAVRDSGGSSLLVDDGEMRAAQAELGRAGLWVELSSAAGLAGLRQVGDVEGPVVCVSTSSGFKDRGVGTGEISAACVDGADWADRAHISSLLGA